MSVRLTLPFFAAASILGAKSAHRTLCANAQGPIVNVYSCAARTIGPVAIVGMPRRKSHRRPVACCVSISITTEQWTCSTSRCSSRSLQARGLRLGSQVA